MIRLIASDIDGTLLPYGEQAISEEVFQEIRRLERLIPGTDEEEEPPEPRRPLWRREPRVEPPPPDLPPQELARRYNRGLKGMRVRSLLVLALFVPACYFRCPSCPVWTTH